MLSSSTCLVTGCSSGIGRALAISLVRRGAVVWATARRVEDLDSLAEHGVTVRRLDVTNLEQVEEVVREAQPLDVLVNNAGFAVEGAVEEVADDELMAVFDTNLFGPWRMCRAALPFMRSRGRGTIVNVSSFGGEVPYPGIGAYRASKFALECLSWTLRLEVAELGITVLDVQPGLVASEFGAKMVRARAMDPEAGPYAGLHAGAQRAYSAMSPTALDPAQVAEAVVAELEAPSGRLRLRIGEDADRMVAAVRSGDAEFERFVQSELGFRWITAAASEPAA